MNVRERPNETEPTRTARTHERIVEVASERIRRQALDPPAVAEIMRAAGPTHGGSYKHLESRDDLIAEATEKALADSDRHVHELTDHAQDPRAALVDRYAQRSTETTRNGLRGRRAR